jgi:hypothetical protein
VARLPITGAAVLALVLASASSCGASKPAASTPTTVAHPTYTSAQQKNYFQDLKESVPSLTPYVDQHGNVALTTLLAFGAGYCNLLQNGDDPSAAVSSLQSQAENLTSKTGFTGSQSTYETIATDALISLCPSEQSWLTPDEQAQLQQVRHNLGNS